LPNWCAIKRYPAFPNLRDESDRDGIRVGHRTQAGNENSAIILNQLYKFTQTGKSPWASSCWAISENRPQVSTSKEVLEKIHQLPQGCCYPPHRQFDLARAKERAHILEGYIIALK